MSAQYDSGMVYHSIREDLEKQGVTFLDMDSGLVNTRTFVKEYFGTMIPAADNEFSALNSAVWSHLRVAWHDSSHARMVSAY